MIVWPSKIAPNGNTKQVWVYDLRANMPSFGVRTPLTHSHFVDFEKVYVGHSCPAIAKRTDQGETGRFRCFSRDLIKKRSVNLDINWLRDENASDHCELPEPDVIAAMIRERLATAMEEMDALTA